MCLKRKYKTQQQYTVKYNGRYVRNRCVTCDYFVRYSFIFRLDQQGTASGIGESDTLKEGDGLKEVDGCASHQAGSTKTAPPEEDTQEIIIVNEHTKELDLNHGRIGKIEKLEPLKHLER